MGRDSDTTGTYGVDVLRGVAILTVVCYHALIAKVGIEQPWEGWTRPSCGFGDARHAAYSFARLGWAGVALFFVISGFCIHLSYLKSRDTFDLGHFFCRRFFRIFPCYLVALTYFAIGSKQNIATRDGMEQVLSHLLLIHNFSEETLFGINPSFWSIATEWQLYLLYPVFLALRRRTSLSGALAVVFSIACVWRAAAMAYSGLPDKSANAAWVFPPVTWFDWCLGAYVAERFSRGERAFRRPALWLALLVSLFFGSTLYKPFTAFSFTLAAGVSACLIDIALHTSWRGGALGRAISFVGLISYSLYLWHQPYINSLVSKVTALTGSEVIAWVALGPLLLIGAWLSYRLFERPGVALGRYLWRLRDRNRK